jgi:hypothetical protein
MKHSHICRLLALLGLLIVSGLLLDPVNAGKSVLQGDDKSLDIERYSNEPLELIELKIGEQSVKDRISTKSRLNEEGFDSVKFKENEGWYKRVWIRMRNVSGRPIYGVGAHLYFQPSDTRTLFSVPLTGSTRLKQGVLEPDDDIILTVSDQAWSLTADILKQHGVEPDLASVKFRIDLVRFGDDLQWSKGHQLRRDPHNPNRWNVTDSKATP